MKSSRFDECWVTDSHERKWKSLLKERLLSVKERLFNIKDWRVKTTLFRKKRKLLVLSFAEQSLFLGVFTVNNLVCRYIATLSFEKKGVAREQESEAHENKEGKKIYCFLIFFDFLVRREGHVTWGPFLRFRETRLPNVSCLSYRHFLFHSPIVSSFIEGIFKGSLSLSLSPQIPRWDSSSFHENLSEDASRWDVSNIFPGTTNKKTRTSICKLEM
jgi:hypothetical protein